MKELTKLLNSVAKKYGEGSLSIFSDMDKQEVKRISTGLPSLDFILGGGIPEGRIIEIFGPNSSSKTSLSLKILTQFQKQYPEKVVAFIDVEHALDPEYAKVLGLDFDNVLFSQPDSAEQALGIMDSIVESGEVSAVVMDSVAKLIPRKEVEGDIGDAEMAMRARLMSQALRKITPKANQNACTCIFINQIRASMNMYGPSEVCPGGQALPFDASVRLRTGLKALDENTGKVTIKTVKNKVGQPYRTTEINLKYGVGYDVVSDVVSTGLMKGVITKNGSFLAFNNQKWHGEDALKEAVKEDELLLAKITKAIHD